MIDLEKTLLKSNYAIEKVDVGLLITDLHVLLIEVDGICDGVEISPAI